MRLRPRIGATINGATLWVRLGPFSFQPAEFAKILLALEEIGMSFLQIDLRARL